MVILYFFCLEIVNSQTPLTKWVPLFGDPQKSSLIQYDYINNISLFGLGLDNGSNPNAKFHVRDVLSTRPVFEVEGTNGEGNVQNLVKVDGYSYGVFQTGSTLINRFAGNLELGEIAYYPYFIHTKHTSLQFRFSTGIYSNDNSPVFKTILNLKCYQDLCETEVTGHLITDSLKVRGIAKTDRIQIINNAGLNRLLVSDQFGNGIWTVPQFNDNDWLRTKDDNLYSNCRNVGIGTDMPEDKFQVNEKARKLTIGSAGGQSLNWGTSYIGFNASRQPENWIFSSDGAHNGGAIMYSDVFGNIRFINVKSKDWSNLPQYFLDNEIVNMTKMTISNNGNVGIGTQNPKVALDVNMHGETTIRSFSLGSYSASIWTKNYNGGYGLTIDEEGVGHIKENADEPNTIISFHNGRVGIGCEDFERVPGNHLLFVAGGITTEDIQVKLQGNWYDNVFSNNYPLLSLLNLEKFLTINKHLPDIPSEAEIKTDGINLGKMNALLLKKVEELTLYLIDQQKQINALKVQLNELK